MTMARLAFTPAPPPLTGGCRRLHLPAAGDLPGLNLWMNRPASERPVRGWPAMVLLDGEAYFVAAAEMAQRLARRPAKTRIDPLMIVGVTLDDPDDRHSAYRFSDASDQPHAGALGAQLLHRLANDVLPAMAAEGADLANLTLFGHSMSGLFALEARAAAAPFARYVAVSPSIWAAPSVIAAQPSGPAGRHDLLVVVGDHEENDSLPRAHLERRMVSNARRLSNGPGERLEVLEGEDHGSTPYAALPAALRFASLEAHEPGLN